MPTPPYSREHTRRGKKVMMELCLLLLLIFYMGSIGRALILCVWVALGKQEETKKGGESD
jgi:hypothetical protein